MDEIIEEQKGFFQFIENSIIKNGKISHAYLIDTKGYNDYQKIVLEFIKNILAVNKNDEEIEKINFQLDNDEYVDLKYIYPDGAYIKKEQLIVLESQFMKKSLLDNKLIYVIDPAEKLNDSSANTILKFLEEPPDDVVAILVTENRYNVLETIVSRCQILSLKNKVDITISDELIEFVKDMHNPKKILIKYDYYLDKVFSDRSIALDNLKAIEEYLFGDIKNNDNQNYILGQIELIEKEKERLQYNINIKIWFSNYIFNIMEVIKNA